MYLPFVHHTNSMRGPEFLEQCSSKHHQRKNVISRRSCVSLSTCHFPHVWLSSQLPRVITLKNECPVRQVLPVEVAGYLVGKWCTEREV